MRAEVAISKTRMPHKGKFAHAQKVTSTIWKVNGERVLHLEIARERGPYVVVRMDAHATKLVAEQMLALIGVKIDD